MIWDPQSAALLTGHHAELYRESIGALVDVLTECRDDNEDSAWCYGITLFDELPWKQQLALVVGVSACVLEGIGDHEDWGVLEKAAYYAVYRNIETHLQMEQEIGDLDPNWIDASFESAGISSDEGDETVDEEDLLEDFVDEESTWEVLITEAVREKFQRDEVPEQEILETLSLPSSNDEDDELDETDSSHHAELRHWAALLEILADEALPDRDFELADTLMDADPELVSAIKQSMGISTDYFVATAAEIDDEEIDALLERLAELSEGPESPGVTADF